MKKKIYFADLTYLSDTGVPSCDVMPLGCGYVAAYTKSLFGPQFDIRISRFPDEVAEMCRQDPPDIFAGSCFAWNKNLLMLTAEMIKEISPKTLIVFGGLAFPLDAKGQKMYLETKRIIDFLVPYDGEIAFTNIVKRFLEEGPEKKRMKERPIDGVVFLDDEKALIAGNRTKRPVDLDTFQSPYLMGLLDRFFEQKKFTPMVQTTRGCPHTCAYCWASNKENRAIRFFSLDRVRDELRYITKKAVKNDIYDLLLSDSNFGLYEKDNTIVDMICELQRKYNYPRIFNAPYGKKTDPEHIKHFSKIKGITYCLPLQSTDPKVLKSVKRKMPDLAAVTGYVKCVHSLKKQTGSDIITGLPNETRESHLKTLRDIIECGFDYLEPFTFMLLDGIELDSEEAHRKYRYNIKYRLIPREFGIVNNKYVFETERVVIGTNTYTYEDYIFFRGFHGLLRILVSNDIYKELTHYIKQKRVHLFDWFIYVYEDLSKKDSKASQYFKTYISEAHSELWDSPEALSAYYSLEENYKKLLSRERGDNLMQKYNILSSTVYFDTYVDYFCDLAMRYLNEKYPKKKEETEKEMSDIKKITLAKLSGVITKNIEKTRFLGVAHDILRWIEDGFEKPLSEYRLAHPKTVTFELTDEQVALIRNIFERYDVDANNPYGLYRTTAYISINNYFRQSKRTDTVDSVKDPGRSATIGLAGRRLSIRKK